LSTSRRPGVAKSDQRENRDRGNSIAWGAIRYTILQSRALAARSLEGVMGSRAYNTRRGESASSRKRKSEWGRKAIKRRIKKNKSLGEGGKKEGYVGSHAAIEE